MTPPNVLGTPNPASSVIINRTFGAPSGGVIRGAHHGVDCSASSLITPPNGSSGAGSTLPSIDIVASGEPSTPVISCARSETAAMTKTLNAPKKISTAETVTLDCIFIIPPDY